MYSNRVCKFKLLQKLKRILHLSALVKGYGHGLGKIVDFLNDTCISIEDSHALIHTKSEFCPDFPLYLIVVLYLHHLVALAENRAPVFFFALALVCRIHIRLQYTV